MKRLIIVYNPHSSRYADVKHNVLARARKLSGYLVGKYEVAPTNLDDNIKKLAQILQDGDLVISAGGDATGAIVSNAILHSRKTATLAALPYGNFNDLARTLRTSRLEDVLTGAHSRAVQARPEGDGSDLSHVLYPLEIYIDGVFFRYATCYVTIGMTAEATKIYDSPKIRKKLKTSFGRKISSYTYLAKWYFRHRHQIFLPEFKLNGTLQPKKTSDYIATNSRFMARVMKNEPDYHDPKRFHHKTDRLTNFYRLANLMFKSFFFHVPSTTTTGDILEFTSPATITLQSEGESQIFKDIKKIEIKKSPRPLKIIKI